MGEPNKGLQAMFVMMNAARLGVGNQSLGLTEVAFQNALAYAKDRLQMRSLSGVKAKDKEADPIIVHPDVRKMLLTRQGLSPKAAARCRCSARLLLDNGSTTIPTRRCARTADELVALLTPIVQGLHHRQRPRSRPTPACRCSAAMASSRNGAWSSTCATTAST